MSHKLNFIKVNLIAFTGVLADLEEQAGAEIFLLNLFMTVSQAN